MKVVKIILIVLSSMVMTGILYSCSKENEGNKVEYIPFRFDKDDNWGMIGLDGKILFKDEFKDKPSSVVNGVFRVKTKDGYTVYTASEKPKTIKGLENLKDAGIMSEGLMPIVKRGERIKFVNIKGTEKFTLMPYKGKEISFAFSFYEGFSKIRTSDWKEGFINTSGKIVVEPQWDNIENFHYGLAVAYKKDKNDKKIYYILNRKGNVIKQLSSDISEVSDFDGKYFVANKDTEDGYIVILMDKKGNIIKKFSKKVIDVVMLKNKYIYENKDYFCGINDKNDKTLIRAKYTDISNLGNNTYLARKENNNYVIIDEDDNVIREFEDYKFMKYHKELKLITALNTSNKTELIKCNGKLLSNEDYLLTDEDEDTYWFFDNYNNRYMHCVSSDYFDVTAAVKCITNCIKGNTVKNISLGQNISNLATGNPIYYLNKKVLQKEPENDNVYPISLMEVLVRSNEYIAKEKYQTDYFYGYSFRTYDGVEFNTSAKVDCIELLFSIELSDKKKYVELLSAALKDYLSKNGYTIGYSTELSSMLWSSNSQNVMFICPTFVDKEPKIALFLFNKEKYTIDTKLKMQQFENKYKKDLIIYGNGDDDDLYEGITESPTVVDEEPLP